MNSDTDPLPESIDRLKALVLAQQQKLDQQSQFIEQLLEQIRLARHQHFGIRSERFSVAQMALVFDETEVTAAQDTADDHSSIDGAKSANAVAESIVVPAHIRNAAADVPYRQNYRESTSFICSTTTNVAGVPAAKD